jgi:VIT1/CCC1 family predicted Fe2+/Mn2+ transporter
MMRTTWPESVLSQERVGRSEASPPAYPKSTPASTYQAAGDSVSSRLQALSTEHWSLLTTRSLIYSESLNRVQIFLALLAGAVIGLALLAQVDHSRETFIVAAILILSVVLFVGLATVGRLSTLNRDDFVSVLGGYARARPAL